jgi:hypothetical protein
MTWFGGEKKGKKEEKKKEGGGGKGEKKAWRREACPNAMTPVYMSMYLVN